MSNEVSHNITAALGLRLSFYAGPGLTYDKAAPNKYLQFPVKLNGDREVVLCANDDLPIGSIVLIEPPDSLNTKVTVELGPIVRFNLGTGVDGEDLIGGGVAANGTGGVKAGDFGIVTSVEGDGLVCVLTYGTTVVADAGGGGGGGD